MKRLTAWIFFLILTIFFSLPQFLLADTDVDKWTAGPWQSQGMISWGGENLVVDFGNNGLWNYNGSWIQLSRWNPEHLTAWGKRYLTVDFGSNGLWNFDGNSWEKIAKGTR